MKSDVSKWNSFVENQGLNLNEVGALSRLTLWCRKIDGGLPDDLGAIYDATHCRTDSERLAVLSILYRFFERRDGRLYPSAEVR